MMQTTVRSHIPTISSIVLLFLLSLAIPHTAAAGQYTITGRTMGTFYSIKFISMEEQSPEVWQERVDVRLKELNARLSMFDPKSEISLFNRQPANQPFRLSNDFYRVLLESRHMNTITNGAWDGTIKPLVDLWGFGTINRHDTLPKDSQIQKALARTGFHKLVLADHLLTKKEDGITLDLSSIAKGYGVDAIARFLSTNSIENFLVEIGGELVGSGTNKQEHPWLVGISKPGIKGLNPRIYKVITLKNKAIATSGNYQNYFEKNGKIFSHIINPKTGFPVKNQVVSTSVIAKNCTIADGLATALMVMDVQKGIDLVNGLADTECLIIQKQGNKFISTQSKGFEALEQK
ncbi:MAG: FAD:protein FMN transferase [Desulfobacteraceae bacterium]|nr:FAD:protein FMN transferase [Desulfobacteraceae bacterium]